MPPTNTAEAGVAVILSESKLGEAGGDCFPYLSSASSALTASNSCDVESTSGLASSERIACRLSVQFKPVVKASAQVSRALPDDEFAKAYVQLLADVASCSKGLLRNKYVHEYNSHRGATQRAKQRHISFDERLKDFRDWLVHLGPRPSHGYTVDRINYRKGYAPKNVRWASKRTQAENRRVTKWQAIPDGRKMTVQMLAKEVGLPYSTIYKRLQRGWTAARILSEASKDPLLAWRFPLNLEAVLEPAYQKRNRFQQTRIDFACQYVERVIRHEQQVRPVDEIEDLLRLHAELEAERQDLLALVRQKERESYESLLAAARSASAASPISVQSIAGSQGEPSTVTSKDSYPWNAK